MTYKNKRNFFESDLQLKQFIISRSRYAENDGTSFDNACRLRNFVSGSIPATYDQRCLVDGFLTNPCFQDLHELFNNLRNGKGGFFCGGTADTLTRVYRLFDFKALSLNIGSPSIGLTHMLTLVEVEDSGLTKLVLQDAYFNNTILDIETLSPVDYHDIYKLLNSGRADRLKYSRVNTKKVFLTFDERNSGSINKSLVTFYWNDSNWKDWLKFKVSSENMIYSLMFPFELYEDKNSVSIKGAIESAFIDAFGRG